MAVAVTGFGAFAAAPANAGCLSVAGNGVCEESDLPHVSEQPYPVYSPTEICYLAGCIYEGQLIANLPLVAVDGAQVACIHLDYTCQVPIVVPDLP